LSTTSPEPPGAWTLSNCWGCATSVLAFALVPSFATFPGRRRANITTEIVRELPTTRPLLKATTRVRVRPGLEVTRHARRNDPRRPVWARAT
jgi:hypothetical protein